MHLSDEGLAAIIDTAHRYNRPVTAHAYAPDLVVRLVEMGIDGIEHGSLLDERAIRCMEERDVYLVPTLAAYEDMIGQSGAAENMNPYARSKLLRFGGRMRRARELIRDSRVRLGYGTDFMSKYQTYQCGYEYGAMLRAGISPFRALKAATSVNAGILRRNDIGCIAKGMLADIAAWGRDVLTDENALLACVFVMRSGKIHSVETDV